MSHTKQHLHCKSFSNGYLLILLFVLLVKAPVLHFAVLGLIFLSTPIEKLKKLISQLFYMTLSTKNSLEAKPSCELAVSLGKTFNINT